MCVPHAGSVVSASHEGDPHPQMAFINKARVFKIVTNVAGLVMTV